MAATASPEYEAILDNPRQSRLYVDHRHHREEPFDIEELIRRLDAYRKELRMSQVRERSRQLQEGDSSSFTYRPRYSSRILDPSTRLDRSSRRQTRIFDLEKLDENDPDAYRPSTAHRLSPRRRPGTSDGDSPPADSFYAWTSNPADEDDEVTKARKKFNRSSLASLDPFSFNRLVGKSSKETLRSQADAQSIINDEEVNRARKKQNRNSFASVDIYSLNKLIGRSTVDVSARPQTAPAQDDEITKAKKRFNRSSLAALDPFASRLNRNSTTDTFSRQDNKSTPDLRAAARPSTASAADEKKSKRKSWVDLARGRRDVQQSDAPVMEKQSFIDRLSRRKSRIWAEEPVNKAGIKRPASVLRRSADSAVDLPNGVSSKEKEQEKEDHRERGKKGEKSPKRMKSVFGLLKRLVQ